MPEKSLVDLYPSPESTLPSALHLSYERTWEGKISTYQRFFTKLKNCACHLDSFMRSTYHFWGSNPQYSYLGYPLSCYHWADFPIKKKRDLALSDWSSPSPRIFFTSCKTHLSSGWEAFDTGKLSRLEHISSMNRFITSMGHCQGHLLEAKSEAYHSPNSAGDGFEAIERP